MLIAYSWRDSTLTSPAPCSLSVTKRLKVSRSTLSSLFLFETFHPSTADRPNLTCPVRNSYLWPRRLLAARQALNTAEIARSTVRATESHPVYSWGMASHRSVDHHAVIRLMNPKSRVRRVDAPGEPLGLRPSTSLFGPGFFRWLNHITMSLRPVNKMLPGY